MKQLSIFTTSDSETNNKWKLFVDGASRGNPGPAAIGIYICKDNQEFLRKGYFLGEKTNNQAEYYSLIYGLNLIKEFYKTNDQLLIFSDSQLMVRQLCGAYKIKNLELKKLYNEVTLLLAKFNYKINHIPREKNMIADALANAAFKNKSNVN